MFFPIVRAAAPAALPALLPGSAWCAAAPKMLSTGVGKTERVANKEFSTLLVFAEAMGSYVPDVALENKDALGPSGRQHDLARAEAVHGTGPR